MVRRNKAAASNKPKEHKVKQFSKKTFEELGIETGDELWVVTKPIDHEEPLIPLRGTVSISGFYMGLYEPANETSFKLYPGVHYRRGTPVRAKYTRVDYSELLKVKKRSDNKDIAYFILNDAEDRRSRS